MDTLKCTQPTPLLPRPLPELACFQEYASNLGISNSHHLIIYDRSPFGFYASSRMWWIFRVNICIKLMNFKIKVTLSDYFSFLFSPLF